MHAVENTRGDFCPCFTNKEGVRGWKKDLLVGATKITLPLFFSDVWQRKGLRGRSLEVWQRKELRGEDCGQKPAKRGVALDVWQGKELAYFSVIFTTNYTLNWKNVKRDFWEG